MAYYNTNNAGFYPTYSASNELEAYPFLGQMSATGEADAQTYHPLADPWNMAGQPSHLVGWSTSLQATASYGKHICNIIVE